MKEAAPEARSQRYNEQKADLDNQEQRAAAQRDTRETAQQPNHTPYVAKQMPRPNDPCPCGSGKKFPSSSFFVMDATFDKHMS